MKPFIRQEKRQQRCMILYSEPRSDSAKPAWYPKARGDESGIFPPGPRPNKAAAERFDMSIRYLACDVMGNNYRKRRTPTFRGANKPHTPPPFLKYTKGYVCMISESFFRRSKRRQWEWLPTRDNYYMEERGGTSGPMALRFSR